MLLPGFKLTFRTQVNVLDLLSRGDDVTHALIEDDSGNT